jgi:hypothetical protein
MLFAEVSSNEEIAALIAAQCEARAKAAPKRRPDLNRLPQLRDELAALREREADQSQAADEASSDLAIVNEKIDAAAKKQAPSARLLDGLHARRERHAARLERSKRILSATKSLLKDWPHHAELRELSSLDEAESKI